MEHYAMDRTQPGNRRAPAWRAENRHRAWGRTAASRCSPVDELVPGLIVRITGGQHIPVDVRVTKGESTCDESNLTGESRPVPKAPGDEAYSGTLNLDGLLEARVLRPASQSALQKVVALIESAQKMRAPAQRFTDRFGTHYTYGVLGLCAAMFFVWWLALGPAGVPFACRRAAQRLLPRHDAAGRGVPLRAGPEHSFGDFIGHSRSGRGAGFSSAAGRRSRRWRKWMSWRSIKRAPSPPATCG